MWIKFRWFKFISPTQSVHGKKNSEHENFDVRSCFLLLYISIVSPKEKPHRCVDFQFHILHQRINQFSRWLCKRNLLFGNMPRLITTQNKQKNMAYDFFRVRQVWQFVLSEIFAYEWNLIMFSFPSTLDGDHSCFDKIDWLVSLFQSSRMFFVCREEERGEKTKP